MWYMQMECYLPVVLTTRLTTKILAVFRQQNLCSHKATAIVNAGKHFARARANVLSEVNASASMVNV